MAKKAAKSKSTSKKKATSKKRRKAVKKEYPTFDNLVGQAGRVKVDDEWCDGVVESLGEYDDHGTPHVAVFKVKQSTEILSVNPKDIEEYQGTGF